MEENPWPEGIISDYREETDEHCIVYNINTPQESYEWFRIRCASLVHVRGLWCCSLPVYLASPLHHGSC